MLEKRKFYTDMNPDEIEFLNGFIVGTKKVSITKHAHDAMLNRRININNIYNTLQNGMVLEYHFKNGSHRVLIRGTELVGHSNVLVVLDILQKRIVTCYKNNKSDTHTTLDMSAYDNFDIIAFMG